MPEFEMVSIEEATLKTATGKQAKIVKEYIGYIERLGEGQAGKLQALEGETTTAVRRRLGAAARLTGEALTIKRAGDEVYFWKKSAKGDGRRRRGKAHKESGSEV